jgi:hypothetical protein
MFQESDAENLIFEFLNKYFKDIEEVVSFEESFILECDLVESRIDYFKLKRFIVTAIRNIKDIDFTVFGGLLHKLHDDVFKLFDYYSDFISRNSVSGVIYERDFLKQFKPYVEIEKNMTAAQAHKSTYESRMRSIENMISDIERSPDKKKDTAEGKLEIKRLKEKYADAVHHFAVSRDKLKDLSTQLQDLTNLFKPMFMNLFEMSKDDYIRRLSRVINIKSFYLDKLLWDRASKSARVKKFFSDAQIEGEYDTKTYINYYLKNIRVEHSKDNSWHRYLKEALKGLE